MSNTGDFNYEYDFYKEPYSEIIAKKLLAQSASMAKNKGSSTCTILMLDKLTGKMFSTYLGDSLYMILRYMTNRYDIVYKSKDQMHDFLTPYQLGIDCDSAGLALTDSMTLRHNDVIILASDG
jgi:hypothetical protein